MRSTTLLSLFLFLGALTACPPAPPADDDDSSGDDDDSSGDDDDSAASGLDLTGEWSGGVAADAEPFGVGMLTLTDTGHTLAGSLLLGAGGELVYSLTITGTEDGENLEMVGTDEGWTFVLTGTYNPDYELPDEYPIMGTFTCSATVGENTFDCLEGRAGTFGFIRKGDYAGSGG